MSEKSAFQLNAYPHSPADQTESSSQPPKKKSIRPRLWKAVCCYCCHNMANSMHRFAIDHAQKASLARWDEVMVPDVENLLDWIKLFMVSEKSAQQYFLCRERFGSVLLSRADL
jgi:hypothetical protein